MKEVTTLEKIKEIELMVYRFQVTELNQIEFMLKAFNVMREIADDRDDGKAWESIDQEFEERMK